MADFRPMSPDEAYALGQQQVRQERPPQTRVKAWRLFELQRLLQGKPRTAQELADHFGVTKRSVQRDLQALEHDGQGLEHHGHAYSLKAAPAQLNAVEALAVHAAARLLYHHSPAYNRHYREGLVKLAAMLPEPARSVAMRSTDDLPQRPEESQALEVVAQAWFERRVIRFDYLKPGQSVPERGNELQVYFVEISRSNLATYVIGFERARRQKVRTFKLSRMQGIVTLADTFTVEEMDSFDPREFLTDAWGVVGGGTVGRVDVRLRFAPEAAYRVMEGGYPGMSEPEVHSDGGLTVSVRSGVDGTGLPREVLPWVLSWGPRVEVLGPENVRAYWLKEAREVLARYGQGP